MIAYDIKNEKEMLKLVNICNKYNEDINVYYQKQIIDGKSVLGVASLMGHIVGVEIETDDNEVKEKFAKEIKNESRIN